MYEVLLGVIGMSLRAQIPPNTVYVLSPGSVRMYQLERL